MSLALKDPDRRAAILNSDLEKINSWAKRWKVSFNEEKTELLTFKKDNLPVYPLSFGNIVLEDKECHKHLGLTFQKNCKWEKHIQGMSQTFRSDFSKKLQMGKTYKQHY